MRTAPFLLHNACTWTCTGQNVSAAIFIIDEPGFKDLIPVLRISPEQVWSLLEQMKNEQANEEPAAEAEAAPVGAADADIQ